jgi:membrane fusion protein, multidrug efflux system
MLCRTLAFTVFALMLGGCGKKDAASPAAAIPVLLLYAEDTFVVQRDPIAFGPTVTGLIQPQRRADLRSEVSAVVLQVLKDNGDSVRRGDLLVRLDDTALRDSLASAEDAVRSSGQSFEQLERQLQRLKTLRESGMASTQQLEDAEVRRNNAQSDLSAAKTRVVQARQQLDRTLARAPFDGVVSERKVSVGDTAQVGKELLKVMDPVSMRFEGLVSADAIGAVRVGQTVNFKVNGYGSSEFEGRVRQINPAANATTRQIEVMVDFSNSKPPQLAGLYAEGSITVETKSSLVMPSTSIVREGDKVFAWRIKDESVQMAPLSLGRRDPRVGDFELLNGLNEGDIVIRNPTSNIKDGQKIKLSARGNSGTVATPPSGR